MPSCAQPHSLLATAKLNCLQSLMHDVVTNSVLSGSFYFQDTAPAPITFTSPFRDHSNFEFNLVRNASQFNAASKSSAAPPNCCVLFPSWVRHEVPPLPAGVPDRYSIAFNTFLDSSRPYGSDRYHTTIRW